MRDPALPERLSLGYPAEPDVKVKVMIDFYRLRSRGSVYFQLSEPGLASSSSSTTFGISSIIQPFDSGQFSEQILIS